AAIRNLRPDSGQTSATAATFIPSPRHLPPRHHPRRLHLITSLPPPRHHHLHLATHHHHLPTATISTTPSTTSYPPSPRLHDAIAMVAISTAYTNAHHHFVPLHL
nr:hypothetical protein [Tanacetum cinerariifolium]